jgi:hypothetical protein
VQWEKSDDRRFFHDLSLVDAFRDCCDAAAHPWAAILR